MALGKTERSIDTSIKTGLAAGRRPFRCYRYKCGVGNRGTRDSTRLPWVNSTFLTTSHEMGYLNLKPEQSNIFFKLMEERYRHHSTILTTNLDYAEGPNFLGSRPMVEALLSRLRHYCHTVHIKGPSLRDPQG